MNPELFESPGVRELAKDKSAEVYRDPVGGNYLEKRIYRANEGPNEIACARLPQIKIRLAELFR